MGLTVVDCTPTISMATYLPFVTGAAGGAFIGSLAGVLVTQRKNYHDRETAYSRIHAWHTDLTMSLCSAEKKLSAEAPSKILTDALLPESESDWFAEAKTAVAILGAGPAKNLAEVANLARALRQARPITAPDAQKRIKCVKGKIADLEQASVESKDNTWLTWIKHKYRSNFGILELLLIVIILFFVFYHYSMPWGARECYALWIRSRICLSI
jgi:hypothetical protein